MKKLLKNPAQIVTVNTNGGNLKRGHQLKDIDVLTGHSLLFEDEIIKDFLPNSSIKKFSFDEIIDIKDKTVLPGLVECHTHLMFSGSRSDEFRRKLNGISYEEIALEGGGINKTVAAVRSSSINQLVELAKPRINDFISQGVTTLEIKSGYGLDTENELKMLKAIQELRKDYPIDIASTFLGAHTFPAEFKQNHSVYVDKIINEMIPEISRSKLAEFCDGFCEATAFSVEEIYLIFQQAKKYGLKLRLHTEQFNNIGGLNSALMFDAVSVDHLEVIQDLDIKRLSESSTTAVLLPGVSFFLNYQYAPASKLIDENAIVALATDFNPGSSHIMNISLIMFLAASKMKMKLEEIISAYTINAAKVLGRNKTIGSIEIGKKADFAILDASDYSHLVYNVSKNINCMTIKNGKIIYTSPAYSL